MQNPNHTVDVIPDTFNALVLQNSKRGPVVTFFWSAEAGPCMMLLPKLTKLVDDYGGKFLLTLLNATDHKRFAVELGVTSIPSVGIFPKGQLVETIQGVFSESQFRDSLNHYLPSFSKGTVSARSSGDGPHETWRLTLDRAKQLLGRGHSESASEVLAALPEAAMCDPEIELLQTRLELINLAHELSHAPDKNGFNELTGIEAYRSAAMFFIRDDYHRVRLLLERVIQGDDEELSIRAQKAKWAAFAFLGPEHELCHGEDPHIVKLNAEV